MKDIKQYFKQESEKQLKEINNNHYKVFKEDIKKQIKYIKSDFSVLIYNIVINKNTDFEDFKEKYINLGYYYDIEDDDDSYHEEVYEDLYPLYTVVKREINFFISLLYISVHEYIKCKDERFFNALINEIDNDKECLIYFFKIYMRQIYKLDDIYELIVNNKDLFNQYTSIDRNLNNMLNDVKNYSKDIFLRDTLDSNYKILNKHLPYELCRLINDYLY